MIAASHVLREMKHHLAAACKHMKLGLHLQQKLVEGGLAKQQLRLLIQLGEHQQILDQLIDAS
ncbi:hypothetical protein D3C78_1795870 [compost metagenome]